MATILEFRRIEEAGARNGKPVEGALGEIVIFPGVRIERHAPVDAEPGTGSAERSGASHVRNTSRA